MINLSLEIGNVVARDVLQSPFAGTNDRAMEMHYAIANPVGRWGRGFTEGIVVEAPVEGWDMLSQWIRQMITNGPYGTVRGERDRRGRLLQLASKIDLEVNRLSHHPGYSGRAVLGISAEVLPAWRLVDGDEVLTIAPTAARAYRLADYAEGRLQCGRMEPTPEIIRGRRYTIWEWVSDEPADGSPARSHSSHPAGSAS